MDQASSHVSRMTVPVFASMTVMLMLMLMLMLMQVLMLVSVLMMLLLLRNISLSISTSWFSICISISRVSDGLTFKYCSLGTPASSKPLPAPYQTLP